METLAQFHFLRPLWLLTLLPAGVLIGLLMYRQHPQRAWRQVIAPHLLGHLMVGTESQQHGIQPVYLLALGWFVGVLALAGPSWQREPAPFAEDQAALVIVLKVTPTMLAQDIQPSRLERAVHKIKDLLAIRPAARTALIAYSGSAHRVMPLTRDARIIETFAAELAPETMPVEGDVAAQAIALADLQLTEANLPGSILWITDAVAGDQLDALASGRQAGGAAVDILAVAAGPEVVPPPDSPPAPALDQPALEAAASAVNGALTLVTVDDSDVQHLARSIEQSPNTVAGEGERWRDVGYYLVPLLVLLLLFWFRPGWIVQWSD